MAGWYARAGVVGKHSYRAYLADHDLALLRFPGREYTYTPCLAGGTLVIDLGRTNGIRFPDVSIGEDQGFIAACHRHGVPTFGADRFNFVQVRHGGNTWNPPIEQFAEEVLAEADVDVLAVAQLEARVRVGIDIDGRAPRLARG